MDFFEYEGTVYFVCVCLVLSCFFLRSKQQKNYCFGHVCVCVRVRSVGVILQKRSTAVIYHTETEIRHRPKENKTKQVFSDWCWRWRQRYLSFTYTFSN